MAVLKLVLNCLTSVGKAKPIVMMSKNAKKKPSPIAMITPYEYGHIVILSNLASKKLLFSILAKVYADVLKYSNVSF